MGAVRNADAFGSFAGVNPVCAARNRSSRIRLLAEAPAALQRDSKKPLDHAE